MPKLGVNIDHVATLRQARREFEPDPLYAAEICEKAGADSIVCHLREDRRHIHDQDLQKLKKNVRTRLTLEMSLNPGIIKIAGCLKPDHAMFVPEKREELTTEGGLNVLKQNLRIQKAIKVLKKQGIIVSLFIDPVKKQIKKAKELDADIIELHTGLYAHAKNKTDRQKELDKLKIMAQYGKSLGLSVSAGHGLRYDNVKPVAAIKEIKELNIGHSIIAHSVFVGLSKAVKEMKQLLQ